MISHRIESLAKKRGTKLYTIGEILGAPTNKTRQNKFDKLNSFKKKVDKTHEDLKKIAKFFNVPVTYFFTPEDEQ